MLLNGLLNTKDTFRNINKKICTGPVSKGSNFTKAIIVQRDVSETKLAAIECQETDGKEHLALKKSFWRG